MSTLSIIAWIIGTLAIGGGLLAVRAPAMVRHILDKFPRSVWPGRILLTVDLVWAAYGVSQMHLGGFDPMKIHLYWVTPVCIVLGSLYLDELLSVRTLGGLLLLVAGPMLSAARWHDSDWRLVISVLAYLWILVGLLFLLSPWWFRRIAQRLNTDAILRAAGVGKVLFGLGFIALAVLAY